MNELYVVIATSNLGLMGCHSPLGVNPPGPHFQFGQSLLRFTKSSDLTTCIIQFSIYLEAYADLWLHDPRSAWVDALMGFCVKFDYWIDN